MLRFARRRSVLLAVPPVLLVMMLLTGRPTSPWAPPAESLHLGNIPITDEASARAAVDAQVQSAASGPALVRRTMKLTDPAGKPLAARVRVAFSQDGFHTFETLDVTPDAEGRLPLELDRAAWVVLSVQAPGHVPRWQPPVTWAELQDADLDLTLADSVRVEGTSRWVDGRPMSGVRLAFRPTWTPGEYAGQVASRLKIVDEEVTTDASGRFSCTSLRPGAYRVAFPDRPRWPTLTVSAEDLAKGTIALRAPWSAPVPK